MSASEHMPGARISIVVPSFNHAEFLPRTLDSILYQRPAPFEVIVADGDSNDGTRDILTEYAARFPNIRWHSEPDKGPADAVNKGLKQVSGDIVGIQSSDDVYYDGAFEKVLSVFRSDPECGFVYGDVEGIDERDRIIYTRRMPQPGWHAFFGSSLALPQSSIFFRSELIDRVGYWNPDYYSCDVDYWMRLLFHCKARKIDQVLSAWRRYEDQRTRPDQFHAIWDGFWRMIDESPDVAASPPSVRRMAEASKHLLAIRFPPDESRLRRWRHVLRGAWLMPGFWRYYPVTQLLQLFPGFTVARQLYRTIRGWGGEERPVRYAPIPVPHKDT